MTAPAQEADATETAGAAETGLALMHGVPGPGSAETRTVGGHPVVWAEVNGQTASGFHGVPLASSTSKVIEAAAEAAREARIPLVVSMASTGADITEGFPALHAWGRLAKSLASCSGVVPTLVIVDGPAVSGPALLIGLADLVVMTERSYAFVGGPVMVEQFTGIAIGTDELGGARSHARTTGVASMVVPDVEAARAAIEELLAYLPPNTDTEPERWAVTDPVDRLCPEAGEMIPASSTGGYDVRAVIAAIVDDGSMLEVRAQWATNAVTAFATVGGQPIGVVANQPISLAGTLDIPASQKAARFVTFCDAFNLPIVTLVDTPGFYPGKDLEWRGMIRHGAQLVFAYAQATVPRICVILRKSYGGAYIVMDSKAMGNDICLAWPWAELAVMGGGQAAAILRRRATPEERAEYEAEYAERLLNPYIAAERGFVDAVIEPGETRREVAAALEMLSDKREPLVARKHANTPL
ncbi:MAG: methylmalonyl-CoA carboxyltransferase [Acidimicrobiia bacterium]|jgi:acetyl-CoA carboxylase carboxyltransferase component|nr:methylmalonyl-CoA carboxyltransferase [Acidimicrobiia bacterium]